MVHAIAVVLYYGRGGRLTWGGRRRLACRGGDLTYIMPRPAYVAADDTYRINRNELAGPAYRVGGYEGEVTTRGGDGRETGESKYT